MLLPLISPRPNTGHSLLDAGMDLHCSGVRNVAALTNKQRKDKTAKDDQAQHILPINPCNFVLRLTLAIPLLWFSLLKLTSTITSQNIFLCYLVWIFSYVNYFIIFRCCKVPQDILLTKSHNIYKLELPVIIIHVRIRLDFPLENWFGKRHKLVQCITIKLF